MKIRTLFLLCALTLALPACSNTHYSRSDRTIMGGAAGLGVGAAATGSAGGALIGGVVGAAIGAATY